MEWLLLTLSTSRWDDDDDDDDDGDGDDDDYDDDDDDDGDGDYVGVLTYNAVWLICNICCPLDKMASSW